MTLRWLIILSFLFIGQGGSITAARDIYQPILSPSTLKITEGARVKKSDGSIITYLPTSDCVEVSATPIVIDDFIVFPTFKKGLSPECKKAKVRTGLYAVSTKTGKAYTLVANIAGEASPNYEKGLIVQPLIGEKRGIVWWEKGYVTITKPLQAGIDSAGLLINSTYIVGSVNSPFPVCQKGPNADCGALIATDRTGSILHRLDRTSNLRGWMTAGATTDGKYYYIGTGSGRDGDAAPKPNIKHECSVVKISKDFKIVRTYDDGDDG
jgi:hypothetical protein